MKAKYSLAWPIIGLLSLVALAAVAGAYFVNVVTMRGDLELRDADKAASIHFAVESSIGEDIKRITALAKALQLNTELGEALADAADGARLARVLDAVGSRLDIDILEVTDLGRRIVYSAEASGQSGAAPAPQGVGLALAGKDALVAGLDARGYAIRYIVPLYARGAVAGTLAAGIRVDDAFAREISAETGTSVSIASRGALLASALPVADRKSVV